MGLTAEHPGWGWGCFGLLQMAKSPRGPTYRGRSQCHKCPHTHIPLSGVSVMGGQDGGLAPAHHGPPQGAWMLHKRPQGVARGGDSTKMGSGRVLWFCRSRRGGARGCAASEGGRGSLVGGTRDIASIIGPPQTSPSPLCRGDLVPPATRMLWDNPGQTQSPSQVGKSRPNTCPQSPWPGGDRALRSPFRGHSISAATPTPRHQHLRGTRTLRSHP